MPNNRYKVYLDVCCLSRPLDNWQQDRVRFEGEAVISILEQVRDQKWQLISSEAIEAELERLPNPDKLASILKLLFLASDSVIIDNAVNQRSKALEEMGFGLYDVFHIACAERVQADVLLTTDDRLIRRALRYKHHIQVTLSNPVDWLMTVLMTREDDTDDT
jgi:predicted nucleic acid-binding protein